MGNLITKDVVESNIYEYEKSQHLFGECCNFLAIEKKNSIRIKLEKSHELPDLNSSGLRENL
jgi:hypothetical protein